MARELEPHERVVLERRFVTSSAFEKDSRLTQAAINKRKRNELHLVIGEAAAHVIKGRRS